MDIFVRRREEEIVWVMQIIPRERAVEVPLKCICFWTVEQVRVCFSGGFFLRRSSLLISTEVLEGNSCFSVLLLGHQLAAREAHSQMCKKKDQY